MSKFSRAEIDAEEEEANWQDSYSDLMTDLLAIFVILFSFAMMSQMSQAIQNSKNQAALADNSIGTPYEIATLHESGGQSSAEGENEYEDERFDALFESLKAYINDAGLAQQLSLTKQGDEQILLRVAESVFFDSGRSEINQTAYPMLEEISKILVEYQSFIRIMRIEGHTDNRPIKTKQFDSNWELSTSRAVNVLRHLIQTTQLEPKMFSAVGYSEFYPIDTNDTEEGRMKNRRVDFFIESAK